MSLLCAKIKKTKDRLAQFRVMEIKPNFLKIASPIFELRCSLNENEAAEILKKIAN